MKKMDQNELSERMELISFAVSRVINIVFIVVAVVFALVGVIKIMPHHALLGAIWVVACLGGAVSAFFNLKKLNLLRDSLNEAEDGLTAESEVTDLDTVGMNQDEKETLQQLKTLLEAGLITEEEYAEKRKELLEGRE